MIILAFAFYIHSVSTCLRTGSDTHVDANQKTADVHRASYRLNSISDSDPVINLIAHSGSSTALKSDKREVLKNGKLALYWLNSGSGRDPTSDVTNLSDPSTSLKRTNSRGVGSGKSAQNFELARRLGSGLNPAPSRDISDFPDASAFLKRARRQVQEKAGVAELQGVLRSSENIDALKKKVIGMMLQSMYSAQERLWPLEPVVTKYEHLTPYRMAFIFMKLDQLVHESHSIFMYLEREMSNKEMTITRRVQLYSHLVRRNVDVTYLVDYISERVPRDQVVRFRQWIIRKEQQENLNKKVIWDKTTTGYIGRATLGRK